MVDLRRMSVRVHFGASDNSPQADDRRRTSVWSNEPRDCAAGEAMKPDVIILMESSLDGKLHPSRWTRSPDGERRNWGSLYERAHEALGGDAWMVGRVTMQEMSKAAPHPPAAVRAVARPLHVAKRDAKSYAIVLDPSGRVHFSG